MNVERALVASPLRATILRPGLLAGESRDERRALEERGAVLSHGLARLYSSLGLTGLADGVRPLDAPEVAQLILSMIADEEDRGDLGARFYELKELHALRRASGA